MDLMCRFCLDVDGIIEPLFDNKKSLISNELVTINNILFKIKNINGWPSGICLDCKSKLIVTHNFINGFLRSYKVLLEQFGSDSNSISTFDGNSEEDDESSHRSSLGSIFNGFMSQLEDEPPPAINQTELIPENRPEEIGFKCQECDRVCKSQNNLLLHQRIHSSDKPFKCGYCSEFFKFKALATKHIKKVHKRTCKECGKLFAKPRGLKQHLYLMSKYRSVNKNCI